MANNRDIMELTGAIDPRLVKLLLNMNSDIHAIRQQVGAVSSMMNQLAEVMGQQAIVMENFKPYIQRLKEMGMAIGSDPSITGEADND